jgi:DNA-binding NarL/FixJ family response regulator
MNRRPRILLADDHTLLLDAFRRVLEPECEVVGTVTDGRALLEVAPRLAPDAVVLDIAMPGLNGLDACVHLKEALPATQVVFLTASLDPDLAVEAFHRGASAYLVKHSAASELFAAIRSALAGHRYLTPLLAKGTPLDVFLNREVPRPGDKLTSRQREVLQLLAEGHAMKEVARLLNVTPRTVAFHKYTMMRQFGIRTSAELVQYAVQQRLVAPRSP